ncbi:Predicted dehydrogenase [Succinivibrio dextrinosolvens DSM 3072]|uniref:Predicted dehydrogenase n=1 Tax=Succinivibrio dextrinosolvens DSM 3072 TaxID=1123324 RepID=A0A1T4V4X6_9GAMM|nr:Gfo/Idh/MocA family oxidoreductase [Succinivibrio dextrinosolvens]SKA60060.1 Predicted dehydrogenase [Succinivibrio dextrinosolvens DSM 3072]
MKLAFIGTGKIIEDALYATQFSENTQAKAIFARPHSKEKAEILAGKYNIEEVFTDYAKLLEESSSDTVYIGLVNSAHYQYAKEAVLAGKNVILEKPLTGFYSQAKELFELAQQNGVFVFEAITILHTPAFSTLKNQLKKIGKIKIFNSNYSQYSSRYDSYRNGIEEHAFDRKYYGGALFDINIYNVHYCVSLFGRPDDVDYFPNIGFNGIDTSGILILKYRDFNAVCIGAKDSDSRCYLSIQGEDGDILVENKPNNIEKIKVKFVDKTNTATTRDASGASVRATITEEFETPKCNHRMSQEFTDFANIIDSGDTKKAQELSEESLTVIETLERARLKADISFE